MHTALPDILPLVPLAGVILLPRGRMTMNISEPSGLALIDDALGQGRLVGIMQPSGETTTGTATPDMYSVGCAGRITSFNETDEGRYLLNLQGICRFRLREEAEPQHGYRRIKPDWTPYFDDLNPPLDEKNVDRAHLMMAVRPYFKMHEFAADWPSIEETETESLIAALSMICPFAPNEKQGLLEAQTLKSRAELLIALLEMGTLAKTDEKIARH